MKKIILACFSVLMTVGLANVNAQSISGGIKAEANMSNFLLSDMDGVESTMKVGPNLGGFLKIEFNDNFAIQPEMMFFYRNAEQKTAVGKDDFQQWGMQIPVYAVGQTNMGAGKAYIGVGPYVGFGFNAEMKDAGTDLYKEVGGSKVMNRWDFGAGAMVGYEFSNRIQINAGYQIGLIDQLDANKDNATMRTQTVSLGIGYRF